MVIFLHSQPTIILWFTKNMTPYPIWHPCAQMKDYESFQPLWIESAKGSYLKTKDDRLIIDAISSWWCKSFGHSHEHLKAALLKQLEKFEHVLAANTTNDTLLALAQKLTQLTTTLKKVFFAGDGSVAVEIALKMSLQARKILGQPERTQFLRLENGYHGETIGALSVSDMPLYSQPFKPLLFNAKTISSIPYLHHRDHPLWNNCEEHWQKIVADLAPYCETATALIVEPIVQGAAGMKIYSQDLLKRLRNWTKQHDIHLIADEIMTGIGRTGKMLACEHAQIEPDILCLSKGLTAGWLPFSAVLTTNELYQLFYDDYHTGKAFLHSHTYCGNALGASVALEVLHIFEEENILEQINFLQQKMHAAMNEVAHNTRQLQNVRSIGAIVAADLINPQGKPRLGYEVYQKAVELGALLRPLGNTIYWLLPFNTSVDTLTKLQDITQQAIVACT